MRRQGRGTALLMLGGLAVVVLLMLLLGSDRAGPYDLDSAQPSGYGGLRLILREVGVKTVERDLADLRSDRLAGSDVVFVPRSAELSSATSRLLRGLAEEGLHVVVAGPPGPPGETLDIGEDPATGRLPFVGISPGHCDDERFAGLRDIRVEGVPPLTVPEGARSCFGNGRLAYLVTRTLGGGDLTSVASPVLFTNAFMRAHTHPVVERQADNSVVAVGLLAPAGTARVVVIRDGLDVPLPDGGRSAWGLMSSGWQLALAQLAAAAALWIWWRSIRHGRLVREPGLVSVAGSDLVDAVGDLHRRQGHPDLAAGGVRRAVRFELCALLGVDSYIDDASLASLVATRTGRDPEAVLGALSRAAVGSDEQLVAVARELSSIREELKRV